VRLAILALGWCLPPSPLSAAERPWTLSLSTGTLSSYSYQVFSPDYGTQVYEERFLGSAVFAAGAARKLAGPFLLETELAGLRYSRDIPLAFPAYLPSVEAPELRLTTEVFSAAVGLRFQPRLVGGDKPAPYLKIAPALYRARWTDRLTQEFPVERSSSESFVRFVPGFVAGAGLSFPVDSRFGLELGGRYTHSANFGYREFGHHGTGTFEGLREWSLLGSVTVRP